MKRIAIGVHLRREDVEPVADAIPIGDLFLSALAVSEDQPTGDRDLLLRVAEVRARLLETSTFVAVRYGFAFRSNAEALAKCAPFLESWSAALRENHGRVELTLKVAATSPSPRPDRHSFEKGADYLRALQAAKQAVSVDSAFRREVESRLAPLCVKWKWTARDQASLEFCGLIDRDKLEELSRTGEAIKAAQPEVPFLLSAPWPLEVFTGADHE
jgi:gas vesicle protein GvpL/GvpF